MRKKIVIRWLKLFLLVYAVVGIAWYYGQDRLLLHPVKMDANEPYNFGQPFTELNLNYDTATNLNVVEFKATDRPADSVAKGVVLYFHGNSYNITHDGPHAIQFTSKGYEVWMIDYPGFGKSTGGRTEKELYAYSLVFYKLARSRWKPAQIVLYGRSFGTGIAAQLASVRDCRRLILDCPYYSMTSIFRRYLFLYPVGMMLHYHLPTNEYLPAVTAPITIFHGDADGVVPYSNSRRLVPLLKPGDEFVTIPGAGHNDLHDAPLFKDKLDSIMSL
jgi:pimeloyl-ACP methyl ester carboxylesterase